MRVVLLALLVSVAVRDGGGFLSNNLGFMGSAYRPPTAWKYMTRLSDASIFIQLCMDAGEYALFRKAPHTYFIPANEAFYGFAPYELDNIKNNHFLLKQLIRFHLMRGARHVPDDFPTGTGGVARISLWGKSGSLFAADDYTQTVQGEAVRTYVNRAYPGLPGEDEWGAALSVNDARVLKHKRVKNGHVYVVDHVLVPPSMMRMLYHYKRK